MNDYQLNDEIARGRYSVVYKGRRRCTVQYYAISSIEKYCRQRVLSNVRIWRSLHHSSIVEFHGWYETQNHLWIISEYCAGGDLQMLLSSQENPLHESVLRAFARDIANGLYYLHTKGLLYNNLRPSKLLVDSTATVRFYDFSLCCRLEDSTQHVRRGVPRYMAPELFLLGKGTPSMASDLWSLGCILYELASGFPLFASDDIEQIISEILTAPFKPIPHCSTDFNYLLERLLTKNPLARASWDDVWTSIFMKPTSPSNSPFPDPHMGIQLYTCPLHSLKGDFLVSQGDALVIAKRCLDNARANAAIISQGLVAGTTTKLDPTMELLFDPPPSDEGGKLFEQAENAPPLAKEPSSPFTGLPEDKKVLSPTARDTVNGPGTSTNPSPEQDEKLSSKFESTQSVSDFQPTRLQFSGLEDSTLTSLKNLKIQDWSSPDMRACLNEILWHSSDLNIRPLAYNRQIETTAIGSFSATSYDWPFSAYTLKELKELSGESLTHHLSAVYHTLSARACSYEERAHIVRYLESISFDASIATLIANSSMMPFCLKLLSCKDTPQHFRVVALSFVGVLLRYATFLHPIFAKSKFLHQIINLFVTEESTTLQRKLMACLGELLFFIASQRHQDRERWRLPIVEIQEAFTTALMHEDIIVKHYAVKAVENLSSIDNNDLACNIFATKAFLKLLFDVYAPSSSPTTNDSMRCSALCAAAKLACTQGHLILFALKSIPFSRVGSSQWMGDPFEAIHSAQAIVTLINASLMRCFISAATLSLSNNDGTFIPPNESIVSNKKMDRTSTSIQYQSSVSEEAETLSIIYHSIEEILSLICDRSGNVSSALKGKAIVFTALYSHVGDHVLNRLLSERMIAFLDRAVAETDAYVQKCVTFFTRVLSRFLNKKVKLLSERVLSFTGTFLSSIRGLFSSSNIRRILELEPVFFEGLAQCLKACLHNADYSAHEAAFHSFVDCFLQSSEIVLKYNDAIFSTLVPAFIPILRQKERERRFFALHFLLLVMSSVDSNTVGVHKSVSSRAIHTIAREISEVIPDAVAEETPIPMLSFRLLVTCMIHLPSVVHTIDQESLLLLLIDNLKRIDVDESFLHPLMLTHILLELGNRKSLLPVCVEKKLVRNVVVPILSSSKDVEEQLLEVCCELGLFLIREIMNNPRFDSEVELLPFVKKNGLKKIFFPLCLSLNVPLSSASSEIVYHLTTLYETVRAEIINGEGLSVLKHIVQNLPNSHVSTASYFLKSLTYTLKLSKECDYDISSTRSSIYQWARNVINDENIDACVSKELADLISTLKPPNSPDGMITHPKNLISTP